MRGTQKPESVAVAWNFGNELNRIPKQRRGGPYKDTGRITNDCLYLNIFLIVQVSKRNEKTVFQRTTFCAHVRAEQNSIRRSLIPEYFALPFILVYG